MVETIVEAHNSALLLDYQPDCLRIEHSIPHLLYRVGQRVMVHLNDRILPVDPLRGSHHSLEKANITLLAELLDPTLDGETTLFKGRNIWMF